jgi:hypothetical protein
MGFCTFEVQDDGRVAVCAACGSEVTLPPGVNAGDVVAECEGDAATTPLDVNIVGKAGRFASELSVWIAADRPVRSPELIAEIFETHCKPCEHFVPHKKKLNRGKCGLCGCRLSAVAAGAVKLNKLEWATTQCPANPPKWLPEVDEVASAGRSPATTTPAT